MPETEKKNGLELLKNVEIEKYNGVDVKEVGKNKNSLISYLTKYVTINDIELYHLPWHCSRDVSRLFGLCPPKPGEGLANRKLYINKKPSYAIYDQTSVVNPEISSECDVGCVHRSPEKV
jgi:hypothetical protein